MSDVGTSAFLLAWAPIALVALLAIVFRRSALELAFAGIASAALLALTYFRTAPGVLWRASLDGVLTNLPLLLLVFFGIVLSSVLLRSGSLQRLVQWLAGGRSTSLSQLLSVGAGNFLEGAGVVAEPVAAPMLHAGGLGGEAAAILSVQGYSGILALSLAGNLVLVMQTLTGLPLQTLAWASMILSIPALAGLVLTIPLTERRGGRPAGLAAPSWWSLLLGIAVFCGAAAAMTYWVSFSMAAMVAGLVLIAALLAVAGHRPRYYPHLLRDLLPFLFLLVSLGLVNLVPTLKHLTYEVLVIRLAPIPIHPVVLRPLFSAYTYLLLAVVLALLLFRSGWRPTVSLLAGSLRKAAVPVLAMAIFGAMGQIISYSGYDTSFGAPLPGRNMAVVLAAGLLALSGSYYPLFAPLLGWVGTFLTGYGVAAVGLFGFLQVEAAARLGLSPALLVAAVAVGSGVGGVSSPLKLAMAAPLVGASGREGDMLRYTIPLGLGASLLVGVVTWFLRGWTP